MVLTPKDRVNGEIVEDLLPSGSRLYIPRLEVSANYTCRVVNKAGPAEKSAFVFLISRECLLACLALYMLLLWLRGVAVDCSRWTVWGLSCDVIFRGALHLQKRCH